jgi:hypothetical protein
LSQNSSNTDFPQKLEAASSKNATEFIDEDKFLFLEYGFSLWDLI